MCSRDYLYETNKQIVKITEFRKLIREEIRKVMKEAKVSDAKPFKDARTGQIIQRGVDFDKNLTGDNSEIEFLVTGGKSGWALKSKKPSSKSNSLAWSKANDADKLPAKVVLSSDYEGDWEETAPDTWQDDFEALQNYLDKKYKDGKDFGVMIGMGDEVFNALFIVNTTILQDPTVKKYIKKIMSYGGLELEKGSV